MANNKETNPVSAETLVDWLAAFGSTPENGVTRLLYDRSWKEALIGLESLMKQAGLHVYRDCVGNLFARLAGKNSDQGTILTGSHFDTVVNGGKYDGAYGIIAAFLAVTEVASEHGKPDYPIEIVCLCEEEGSRFPQAFWGSRSITGDITLSDMQGLQDSDGLTFTDAMEAAGFPVKAYQQPVRSDIRQFIELHIEQGLILEKEQQQLGIATHIVGQRRFFVTITGESNHAGTTPMPYRKDALQAAAASISFIRQQAEELQNGLVATIGKIEVTPNVANVIPGEVMFTVDVRHYQKDVLTAFCQNIEAYIRAYTSTNSMTVTFTPMMEAEPIAFDTDLINTASAAAASEGLRYKKMVSGAGHDAQIFGAHFPTALLFIPSHNGISHSPEEYSFPEDLTNGVRVLKNMLLKIAYKQEESVCTKIYTSQAEQS